MEIGDQLKIVANHHDQLVLRYHELGKTIAQLTALGCIDAKEYWKDGRYLYLLYPMRNGNRKKKYIGNHPLRIEEARAKLANYKTRFDLVLTQQKVQEELSDIETLVNGLLHICSRSDMSAKFVLSENRSLGTAGSCSRRKIVPNAPREMGTGSRAIVSDSVPNVNR